MGLETKERQLADNIFDKLYVKEQEKVERLYELYEKTLKYQGYPISNRIRLHTNGDFFNELYFISWCYFASRNPNLSIYAYTKSLIYIVDNNEYIPENLKITASRGGRYDTLLKTNREVFKKIAKVVYSEEEAINEGIPIDTTDEYAWNDYVGEFAHVLHGTQPINTTAGKALQKLKENGHIGYSRQNYKRKLATLSKEVCKELDILYCSPGNAKLNNTLIISLPAGYTCPGAMDCRSLCNKFTGMISDYPSTKYRCYAASMEARSPSLRDALWHNSYLITNILAK